ncbi:VOC family protein [Allopusillimonas ginsengisoli]|nr:VOC family protein [Allopusillimonas ginsengisoli]
MMRDELMNRAPLFERDGYRLTDLAVHNLGSINRLIPLDSTYIELLGWPAGKPPQRKEIAEQPLGLDALVFRTEDAQATFERLQRAGYKVNPVQRLERPLLFQGKECLARFDTVRFSVQPVAGLRIYFCQHLTPEFIWNEAAIHHKNGAKSLDQIIVEAPAAQTVSTQLAAVIDGRPHIREDGANVIDLPNLQLVVKSTPNLSAASIARASILHEDGRICVFDPHL